MHGNKDSRHHHRCIPRGSHGGTTGMNLSLFFFLPALVCAHPFVLQSNSIYLMQGGPWRRWLHFNSNNNIANRAKKRETG